MFGDVAAQDIVAGKDIIRLAAGRSSSAQKRARGAKFLFQKRQASILAPLGELVILKTSRLEESINRQIVEAAVLTDVQIRQVESESIEGAAHGIHGKVGKASGTAGVECFGEQFQVGLELGRMLKTNAAFQNFRVFDFPGRNRQTVLKVEHKLAPRFVGIRLRQCLGKRGRFTTELVECALQLLRKVLKIAGERKVRRQVLQLAVEHNQGAEAKIAKRGLCDGRRHKRMSIPVSPDPSAEADFGHSQGICNQRGIKARSAPSFAEALVETRQRGRKNLAQVINNSTAFRSDIRLFEQNFTGPPQAF